MLRGKEEIREGDQWFESMRPVGYKLNKGAIIKKRFAIKHIYVIISTIN